MKKILTLVIRGSISLSLVCLLPQPYAARAFQKESQRGDHFKKWLEEEGGGWSNTYPWERWFYRDLPFLRDRVAVLAAIPLAGQEPGRYKIAFEARDRIAGDSQTASLDFDVLN